MNFYNIDEINLKLQKIYNRGDIFKSYIQKTDIFPIIIKLKTIQEKDIQGNFSVLLHKLKVLKQSKLPLDYKQFDFKRLGKQTLPVCVKIDGVLEYCNIMNNQDYYDKFVKYYELIDERYPSLKELFLKKPMIVLEYSEEWKKFFRIIEFFINNHNPNIYIREIVLEDIDTKYIEKYKKILDIILSNILNLEILTTQVNFAFEKKYNLKYSLPQVRFRILDDKLFVVGLSDLTLGIDEFNSLDIKCKKVFIVENKITTLSFPMVKDSIVIFGSGYSVGVLKNTKWLNDKEIYYWGDIDIDGFAILSQIRGYFSHIKSFFMDTDIVEKFKNIATTYKRKNIEQSNLNLIDDEIILYKRVQNDFYGINFRLEQERLPFDFIKQEILKI